MLGYGFPACIRFEGRFPVTIAMKRISVLAREPISRILSWEIIYLCSQPEGSGGQPSSAFLLGLAPARVCQAVSVTRNAGGLLHHRFTLARRETPSAVYSLWHFP